MRSFWYITLKAPLIIAAIRAVQSRIKRETCDHPYCEDEVDHEKYIRDAEHDGKGEVMLKPGDLFVLYSSTGSGYLVTDTVAPHDNGSLRVRRELRKHINLSTRLTMYHVKIPKKLSTPINTSDWEFSHTEVLFDYLRFIIQVSYAVGSIKFDETQRYDLLSLGLGGGSANSFFRHATKNVYVTVIEICEKSVELAKKYFGFRIDERQKCIIHDATVFVKEAAGRDEKYDIIVMDVSHSIDGMLAAPPRVFADPSVVQYYPKILKRSGALIVDYLNMYDQTIALDQFMKLLTSYFAGCMLFTAMRNDLWLFQIIVCVNQYSKYKTMESGTFERILEKTRKKLKFPSLTYQLVTNMRIFSSST